MDDHESDDSTDGGTEYTDSQEDSKQLIDEVVVDFMAGLFDRVRNTSGRSLEDLLDSQTDWYKKINPSSRSVPLSYDPSRSQRDSEELIRARKTRAILEPSSLVLRRLSNLIDVQLEYCIDQVDAIQSRAVFSSLPDEILSYVLEFGTHCRPVDFMGSEGMITKAASIIESVKAAVRLSSVCSRFRRLAIHIPSMWNRICVGMPQEMLAICVLRAGPTGLDIIYHNSVMHYQAPRKLAQLESFLEFAMPHVGTWRRFDHYCYTYLNNRALPESEMNLLESMTNGLHSVRLSELNVRYRGDGDDFLQNSHPDHNQWHKIFHYYSTWSLPSLRSMSTFNLIPIPFSGSSSIGSLHVKMDFSSYGSKPFRSFDAGSLSIFLSSCPVLRKLSLGLTQATLPIDAPPINQPLPNTIEEFDLYIERCEKTSIGYFINSMRWPNVNSMAFTVRCSKGDEFFSHPMENILEVSSNPDVFPSLEHLHFSGLYGFLNPYEQPIGLPLNCIPKLKTLNLHLRGLDLDPLAKNQAIPVGLSSIVLEDSNFGRRWVAEVWRRVQKQGRNPTQSLQIFVKDADRGTLSQVQSIEELENFKVEVLA
ncbi:hypothetical protein SCHPADRAFT_996882 [Schizopora paradoxa]|uniref:Uncharacterized protein n=1 Tax=Schizopora paradoxa TaxID=27342 RepID=A0A0H2RR65_9AGAM|nr:hypothetical protein SCHPADRAFT_996882 [Schizopora paradoxa]